MNYFPSIPHEVVLYVGKAVAADGRPRFIWFDEDAPVIGQERPPVSHIEVCILGGECGRVVRKDLRPCDAPHEAERLHRLGGRLWESPDHLPTLVDLGGHEEPGRF